MVGLVCVGWVGFLLGLVGFTPALLPRCSGFTPALLPLLTRFTTTSFRRRSHFAPALHSPLALPPCTPALHSRLAPTSLPTPASLSNPQVTVFFSRPHSRKGQREMDPDPRIQAETPEGLSKNGARTGRLTEVT